MMSALIALFHATFFCAAGSGRSRATFIDEGSNPPVESIKSTVIFTLEELQKSRDRRRKAGRLVAMGHATDLRIQGQQLLYQFDASSCYLLVTNAGCLFEEVVCFTLISKDYSRVLASRCIGGPDTPCWLRNIEWKDSRCFLASFAKEEEYWHFSIRDRSFPLLYPRLKMSRLTH